MKKILSVVAKNRKSAMRIFMLTNAKKKGAFR